MRKILSFLLVLIIAAVAFACVACAPDGSNPEHEDSPEHEHTFATEWSKDETDHWHAATCSHSGEVKDKAAHSASGFTSVSYNGGHKSVCSVCGYEFTEPHEFGADSNKCTKCDFTFVGTEGLDFAPVVVDGQTAAYTVTGYSGTAALKDLIIPNIYEGKPVTAVGDNAFTSQPNLRSLLVAPSVVSIGREAFADCGALDKPELSENVEYIGYRAFDNTKFYNSARTQTNKNTSDGGIYLDNYLLKFVTTVSRKTAKIKDGTTLIAAYAFDENDAADTITGAQLPDSLVYINDYAFQMTLLREIEITKNVKRIGDYAFLKCEELNKVTFAADCELTAIGLRAFRECAALTAIALPSKLEHIGNRAFSKSGIESVTVPASVTLIAASAFDDSALKKIEFASGSKLKQIGEKAFSKTAITQIIIPASVTELDSEVFKYIDAATLKIYFEGSEVPVDSASDWNSIGAPYYFYSETQPTAAGDFWRYVDGQPQAW